MRPGLVRVRSLQSEFRYDEVSVAELPGPSTWQCRVFDCVGRLHSVVFDLKHVITSTWSGKISTLPCTFLGQLHATGRDLSCTHRASTPGKAMFQMMGVFADFERSMIAERVRAGLRRARSEGKRLGRPPIAPELEERIRKALNAPGRTEGVRVIAKRFNVGPGTVQKTSTSPFEASAALA
jgi:Resolvase, N terminal domain